jgi:hypothetical protein
MAIDPYYPPTTRRSEQMKGERTIVTLLVHLRTRDRYYEEHDAFVEEEWRYRRETGPWSSDEEFDAWRERNRAHFEQYWFWPPWRYNDIVGYVHVYYDGGQRVVAEAYLPKKRISRQLKRKEFYWYGKIGEGWMSKVDNEGLRQAIMAAVKQASRRLAERRTPLHLEYDFHFIECLDIVKLATPPAP